MKINSVLMEHNILYTPFLKVIFVLKNHVSKPKKEG
jgi:hypothetical protein